MRLKDTQVSTYILGMISIMKGSMMEKIISRVKQITAKKELELETAQSALQHAEDALLEILPELLRRYIEYSLVMLMHAPAEQVKVEHQFNLESINNRLTKAITSLCERYKEKGIYVTHEFGKLTVSLVDECYW